MKIGVILIFLAACSNYASDISADHWMVVEPPLDTPDGTKCWVWIGGGTSNAQYGGPVCKFPDSHQ